MLFKIILLLFLIHQSRSTDHEDKLSDLNSKLKYLHFSFLSRELRLTKLASDLHGFVSNLYTKGKSGSTPMLAVHFHHIIELKNLAKGLGSFRNFAPTYSELSSCYFVKYKIQIMDFEVEKLKGIRKSLSFRKSIYLYTMDLGEIDVRRFKKEYDAVLAKLSLILKEYSKYFQALNHALKFLPSANENLIELHDHLCKEPCERNLSKIAYRSAIEESVAIIDQELLAEFHKFSEATKHVKVHISSLNFSTTFGSVFEIFSSKSWTVDHQIIYKCKDFLHRYKYLTTKEFQYAQLMINIENFRDSLQSIEGLKNKSEVIKISTDYHKMINSSRNELLRAAMMFRRYAKFVCDCPFKMERKTTTKRTTTSTTTTVSSKETTTEEYAFDPEVKRKRWKDWSRHCSGIMPLIIGEISEDGFPSGTYLDGSTVYPGQGYTPFFGFGITHVGRVIVDTKNTSSGNLYAVDYTKEVNTSERILFYTKNPLLGWRVTNASEIMLERDLIVVQKKFIIRCNYTAENGTYQQLGHYEIETSMTFCWNGTKVDHPQVFEVLGCWPDLSGSQCGSLFESDSYYLNFSPKRSFGLMSGTFSDGSKVFPGTIYAPKFGGLRPARISPGIGLSPDLESDKEISKNSSSSQFFYADPQLKWARANLQSADKVPGVIKLQENGNFSTIVARFNFTVNKQIFQQIGIYEIKTSRAYYWNGTKVVDHKGIFDVLTCSQCENGGSGVFCCQTGADNAECSLNLESSEAKLVTDLCGITTEMPAPVNFTQMFMTKFGFPSGADSKNSSIFPGLEFFTKHEENETSFVYSFTEIYTNKTNYGDRWRKVLEGDGKVEDFKLMMFKKVPNLKWISTDTKNISKIAGVVDIYNELYGIFCIARINLTGGGKTIGVYVEKKSKVFYLENELKKEHEGAFDVLGCA